MTVTSKEMEKKRGALDAGLLEGTGEKKVKLNGTSDAKNFSGGEKNTPLWMNMETYHGNWLGIEIDKVHLDAIRDVRKTLEIKPRQWYMKTVQAALAGRDVLVITQPGQDKLSLIRQLTAKDDSTLIVVSPRVDWMEKQVSFSAVCSCCHC
jgi:hypothetical protein